ncbi:hypothetical protein CEXT_707521 [Caerostris extrusa]|uniref:Uncharacterized protein n=1 Tax=Caerostris extrusa TaxID=172846 RepID=A0AAV4Y8Y2_CAEEX|nr:hypothetical protein CEXT_707521 [Caerostris extrusa]
MNQATPSHVIWYPNICEQHRHSQRPLITNYKSAELFTPPFESGTSTDRPSISPPQTLPFKFSDTSAMNTRANYRTDLSRGR